MKDIKNLCKIAKLYDIGLFAGRFIRYVVSPNSGIIALPLKISCYEDLVHELSKRECNKKLLLQFSSFHYLALFKIYKEEQIDLEHISSFPFLPNNEAIIVNTSDRFYIIL